MSDLGKWLPIIPAIAGIILFIVFRQRNAVHIPSEERERAAQAWASAQKKDIWLQIPLWVLIGSSGIWGSWVFNYYRIAVPLVCLALMSVLAFYAFREQKVLLKAALPAAYIQNRFYLYLLFIGLLGLIGLLIIIN